MALCYAITVLLATCGVIYGDFSEPSLLAFIFIAISASPLLIGSIGLAKPSQARTSDPQWMSFFRCVFLLLALTNVALLIHGHGFSIPEVMTRQGLFELAGKATVERYTLGTTQGNPILVAATFVSAFLWARSSLPSAISITLGLAPAAIYSVLSTEKWPFYCTISFFMTSILAGQRPASRSPSIATFGLPIASVAIIVSALSLVTRSGNDNSDNLYLAATSFGSTIAHYFFAQYEAFGIWLSSHYLDCCSGGRYSFTGITSLLGLDTRQQGVFADNVVIHGVETNIYTAWRYLVQDFSIFGPTVIVLAYAGAYRYCVQHAMNRPAAALFTLLGITTFLQINTTIFVHNSVALAAFVCATISAATCVPGTALAQDPHG